MISLKNFSPGAPHMNIDTVLAHYLSYLFWKNLGSFKELFTVSLATSLRRSLNILYTIFSLIGQFFLDVPFLAFHFAMFMSSFVGFKKDKDGEDIHA